MQNHGLPPLPRCHLVRVGKMLERRLGTRGQDQGEDAAEEGVEDGRRVRERPGEDVAEGDEVEVQVERDGVVEPEVFVGNSRPVSCRYNSMSYGV